jgi:calcineurin-like phosphoesterase family protein
VKVAFIGDSGYGKTFRKNLELIRAQDADFVVHEGDFDYRRNPKAFWKAIDEVLGHDYPYFLVIGNHDVGAWDGDDGYAAHMEEHIELFNEESTEAMQIDLGTKKNNYRNWTIDFMGLRLVAVGQDNEKNDEKEMFIKDQLDADDPRWKICNWHKNQAAMQVGGKGNEMDWGVYETCREKGALIITGHEHSYERTKTLVHMETQEVDPSCDDRESVCVGPERTFVVVSGLGGREIRNQQRCSKSYKYPYGCEEWAFIYTNQQNAKHGTLFITFNVGGDPKKASGSFINIEDDPVDLFEITKD